MRYVAPIVASLCISAISFSQANPDAKLLLANFNLPKVQAVTHELRRIRALEQANLIIAIAPSTDARSFKVHQHSHGVLGLESLAIGAQCSLTRFEDAWVFRRINFPFSANRDELGVWLAGISSAQIDAMMGNGLPLSQLTKGKIDAAFRLTGHDSPTGMYYMLGNLDSTRAFLVPTLSISYESDGKRRNAVFGARTKYFAEDRESTFPAVEKPKQRLAEAEPGDLDFGEGRVLVISEIAQMASETFRSPYSYDERFANNAYFISGSYEKLKFEEIFGFLVELKPVPKLLPSDLEELVMRMLPRWSALLRDQWDYENLRKGIGVKASYLKGLGADWEEFLSRNNIQSGDFVTVSPNIHFVISLERFAPPPPGVELFSRGAFRAMTFFQVLK